MKAKPTSFNKGAVITGLITLVSLSVLMMAFLSSASPYVTVAEAKETPGDSLHLPGDLVQRSISSDRKSGRLSFALKDANGEQIDVVYDGAPPSNMSEATRVVAIGKMDGNRFHAHKLLVKCPSKYEGEKQS